VDDPRYGLPDVQAYISDVREETPKMPYQALEQNYEKFKYVVEYHEYLFDVQVRTVATVITTNAKSGDPQIPDKYGGLVFVHETAMPYTMCGNFLGHRGSWTGSNFDGGVYARFSCLPWGIPDFGPTPENYSFNGYWLGIMNAKVETFTSGVATPDIEITHKGWARNIASIGSQLNMYQDGSYTIAYSEIPWDIGKVLDPDIKNVVIVYLPFDLLAGAWEKYDQTYNWYEGSIIECKPVDYYLTYTIRMECLVIREYEFRDPSTSPNPSPIEKPSDYVPFTPYTLWEKYGFWIIIIIVIVIAGLVFFAWISGLGIMGLLLSLFRYTTFDGSGRG